MGIADRDIVRLPRCQGHTCPGVMWSLRYTVEGNLQAWIDLNLTKTIDARYLAVSGPQSLS